MQRLGVAGGGRSSSQRSNSLGNAAGAGLGEGGGGSAAGGLSHTTAIGKLLHCSLVLSSVACNQLCLRAGATVIGTGTGLGNENDRRRLQTTPAHELVLLSLRTLASLSVPSGRLILLVKVSAATLVPPGVEAPSNPQLLFICRLSCTTLRRTASCRICSPTTIASEKRRRPRARACWWRLFTATAPRGRPPPPLRTFSPGCWKS